MPVPDLELVKVLPSKYPGGRDYPETYTIKATLEFCILIVTCIILITQAMLVVRREILCCRLIIIPVKRRYREKRRYLIRDFKACSVRPRAPIVHIVTVIRPQNYIVSN